MNIHHFGTLYIVATPIGNLEDMSFRAIQTLKSVKCIAAEDTRHSTLLLQHFSICTPLIALHEHNERHYTATLLKRLQQGESIALISDAGTPLINDPGYFLVRKAREAGIVIVPIPGPSAIITALSAAGLPTDRFCFEGFLPAHSKRRLQQLESLRAEKRTMVFYEAPHRILSSLQDMLIVFGAARNAVIARELTKLYETIHAAKLADLIKWMKGDPHQTRGEMVVVVEGARESGEKPDALSTQSLLTVLLKELPLKQAVELAAKISGKRKNELYQQALLLKQ